MSHPIPGRDYGENEYPNEAVSTKKKSAKSKAIKKFTHPISKTIEDLKERPGEAPLAKLKRLLK